MDKILVYGNGNIAKVLYYFLKKQFDVVGFTVDKKHILENSIEGLPLVAFENVQEKFEVSKYKMIIAIGYIQMNNIREKKSSAALIFYGDKIYSESFFNYEQLFIDTAGNNKNDLDHFLENDYLNENTIISISKEYIDDISKVKDKLINKIKTINL